MERKVKILFGTNDKVKLVTNEWIDLSDKLRIQGVFANADDIAVIRDFPNGNSIVIDVEKKHISVEEDEEELQRQLKQFRTLGGGY